MDERAWFAPSAVLTFTLGLLAWALMPLTGFSVIPPYFGHFLNWMGVTAAGAAILFVARLIGLSITRTPKPLSTLIGEVRERLGSIALIAAGMSLAGMDMLFFMWVKPELAVISPFWTDAFLAQADFWVFGADPWRFFEGRNLDATAWVYSFFWPAAMMVTLLWLFVQTPSAKRSTCILNYFAIWSLFGPIGQFLFSAAGPIFYARVGLGDRFEPMRENLPWVTNQVADYLWTQYRQGELGLAAGISAMPSLHVATVTWIALTFGVHKSSLTPVAILFALFIWVASVALGWHYASDGLFGVMGALICHSLSRAYVERRRGEQKIPVFQRA